MRDKLGNNKKECNALRAKVDEVQRELVTLREFVKTNEEKIQKLDLHVALDAKVIANLATFVNDHRLSRLCTAVKNGEQQKRLIKLEEKAHETPARQYHAAVISVTEK